MALTRVSRKIISNKARFLHEQKCKQTQVPPSFSASNGQVQKVANKNGLNVRRRIPKRSH